MDLTPEEEEIIKRFRQLSKSQKNAVMASTEAFINWIKTSVSWTWNKLKDSVNDLWNWLKSLF